MALAARCPECNTAFRIVPDQLKISEGWVRCGHCSYVFNAFESQFEISEAALEQTLHEQQSTLKAGASSFVPSQSFSDELTSDESTTEQSRSVDEDSDQTIDLADDNAFEDTTFEDTILQDSDEFELSDTSPDLILSLEEPESTIDLHDDTQTGFDAQDSLLSEFHIGWQDSFDHAESSASLDKQPKTPLPAADTFSDSSLTAETLPPEQSAWDVDLNYDQLFESSLKENSNRQGIEKHNEIPSADHFHTADEEVALDDPDTLQPAQQDSHQPNLHHDIDLQLDQDDGLEVNTSSRFTATAFFPNTQETHQSAQTVFDQTHDDSVLKNPQIETADLSFAPSHHWEESTPSSLAKNADLEANKDTENTVDSRFGNTAFSLSDFLELSDEMSTQSSVDKVISKKISTLTTHENDEDEASPIPSSTLDDHSSFYSESNMLSKSSSKYHSTQKKRKHKKRRSKPDHVSSTRYDENIADNKQADEDIREVSFAKEKNHFAIWNNPAVKFSQYILFIALIVMLFTQLSLIYKDTLATQFPALRPLLSQLCEPFECTVDYPREINNITIYDSSFRRTNSTDPDRYSLMLLLKNTGKQTLELPWVELTLVDNATGSAYSRKIFSPKDLGIQTTYFPAGKEIQIDTQFSIHTDENTSLGFNIILFYP